jgi:DNA-binding MarR family transcriptional regulator
VELEAFRHALREFLHFSAAAAAAAGLASRHYQAMLALRTCPTGEQASTNDLAGELFTKHDSAGELVDRRLRPRLVVRDASRIDRRKVELRPTSCGRKVLAKLAAMHRAELGRFSPRWRRFSVQMSGSKAKTQDPG